MNKLPHHYNNFKYKEIPVPTPPLVYPYWIDAVIYGSNFSKPSIVLPDPSIIPIILLRYMIVGGWWLLLSI